MMIVDGACGAAMRRRQRRLRAAWRHEQQSIAMALAAALRHSRDGGPVTNAAPRRLTTARAGVRPGILSEPGPQVGVVSAACPHSGAPSLSLPMLGEGAVHDGASVQFLLRYTYHAGKK